MLVEELLVTDKNSMVYWMTLRKKEDIVKWTEMALRWEVALEEAMNLS